GPLPAPSPRFAQRSDSKAMPRGAKVKNFLFVFSLLAAASIPAAAQTQAPIRVDCGGSGYTDTKGQLWQADTGYSGGGAGRSDTDLRRRRPHPLFPNHPHTRVKNHNTGST